MRGPRDCWGCDVTNSVFKGYVRYSAGQLTENSPLGAGPARDHLSNNANHVADEAGQTLVNWGAGGTGAADAGSPGYLTPTLTGGNLAAANTYYRIEAWGPMPLLMAADGSSYALRGWLRGYLSAAGTATYRVTVCEASRSAEVRDDAGAANAFTFSTTGTSDAWRDATGDHICQLDGDEMAFAVRGLSALADIGSDHRVSVVVPMVMITVYAKSTAAASVPRLTGLYLAEYVGA